MPDSRLDNLIANYLRRGLAKHPVCLDARAERSRRRGHGLNFHKSFRAILAAAAEGRFLSYKALADESGADWAKVHCAIGKHLWELVSFAHDSGWPMLSAIVVNKPNVATGTMEPETLEGFIGAAKELGYDISDDEAFLREQQEKVFAWAAAKPSQ